jgi:DNA-binding IclR family transcriptional regulator
MSKSDYRVLEALADADKLPVQTPSVLAFNLGISRQQATRSLSTLIEHGYVEKVERGKYRITEAGREEVTST